ncbi:hypothetical protein, partial [Mesorhizobium sp. M1C.F.Ca.ET.188.01.1.1]|uniref:hypothetical protein n=1 Tax=Mesorhizobium sp. M1C.F.Ca.ET.188.01.1.1 TaxID=2563924 RepID=UPI001AEEB2B8
CYMETTNSPSNPLATARGCLVIIGEASTIEKLTNYYTGIKPEDKAGSSSLARLQHQVDSVT